MSLSMFLSVRLFVVFSSPFFFSFFFLFLFLLGAFFNISSQFVHAHIDLPLLRWFLLLLSQLDSQLKFLQNQQNPR